MQNLEKGDRGNRVIATCCKIKEEKMSRCRKLSRKISSFVLLAAMLLSMAISKDFHASRRKLYADLLEDRSVGFVFCGREREDRGDGTHRFTPFANLTIISERIQQEREILKGSG